MLCYIYVAMCACYVVRAMLSYDMQLHVTTCLQKYFILFYVVMSCCGMLCYLCHVILCYVSFVCYYVLLKCYVMLCYVVLSYVLLSYVTLSYVNLSYAVI